jgi:hypothetical protein
MGSATLPGEFGLDPGSQRLGALGGSGAPGGVGHLYVPSVILLVVEIVSPARTSR